MGEDAGRDFDRSRSEHERGRRHATVAEAAEVLGITAEAVRTRIRRGKLDSIKDPPKPGGTVYVLLETDPTRPNLDPTSQRQDQTTDQTGPGEALVDELRDRVAYLERQVEEEREGRRRADTILAQLSQANAEQARTNRALEAPTTESPGAPEMGAETTATNNAHDHQTQAQEPRSSPLKGWHVAALVVLISLVCFGALLYLAVTLLS